VNWISAISELELSLSPEQLSMFSVFEADLYDRNQVMNLTRVPKEECGVRHFLDSLLLSPLIGDGQRVVDIGTGPGFPAWPLACARPDLSVTAIDSSGKMLGFLARHPLPNLEIVNDRAESWGRREKFDVATGRAVAPLGIQLELSAPVVRLGGLVIPMRTPNDVFELESLKGLGLELVSIERQVLPGTDIERVFPIYKKIAATPRKYPRDWATIRKKPLN
jgi:16S rRNA (guanine527-N7)-methyltransferase